MSRGPADAATRRAQSASQSAENSTTGTGTVPGRGGAALSCGTKRISVFGAPGRVRVAWPGTVGAAVRRHSRSASGCRITAGPLAAHIRTASLMRPSHQCGPEQSLRSAVTWRPVGSIMTVGAWTGPRSDALTPSLPPESAMNQARTSRNAPTARVASPKSLASGRQMSIACPVSTTTARLSQRPLAGDMTGSHGRRPIRSAIRAAVPSSSSTRSCRAGVLRLSGRRERWMASGCRSIGAVGTSSESESVPPCGAATGGGYKGCRSSAL